ncbi:F-box-like domain-containing protein [Criblamydia sequanensis]|uniref:F-box and WD repeat-containing protein n=1 Tax=Candidatus Criblamydia sequanensis CRIB-18 TaxID=1437425 RepID=A0A090D280_9BACT|nr:F-box-like domain-containing protein [Criblamydia sequanensis]CDR34123.1 F-box and WD repeat-containing protein [Criblamydia sequanensis CRIB-18]
MSVEEASNNRISNQEDVPYENKDIVSLLPFEIALHLFIMMDVKSIITGSLVSKTWRDITQDAMIWRIKCKNEFPRAFEIVRRDHLFSKEIHLNFYALLSLKHEPVIQTLPFIFKNKYPVSISEEGKVLGVAQFPIDFQDRVLYESVKELANPNFFKLEEPTNIIFSVNDPPFFCYNPTDIESLIYHKNFIIASTHSSIHIFDKETFAFYTKINDFGTRVTCLASSEKYLIAGNDSGKIFFIDTDLKKVIKKQQASRVSITHVFAYGNKVITYDFNRVIKVWDPKSFNLLETADCCFKEKGPLRYPELLSISDKKLFSSSIISSYRKPDAINFSYKSLILIRSLESKKILKEFKILGFITCYEFINNNLVFFMVKQANYYDSWENVGGKLIIFDLKNEKIAFKISLKNTLIALKKVGSQLIGLTNSLSYTWDL